LPYAKETVGRYDFVNFSNIDDWSVVKINDWFLGNKLVCDKNNDINYEQTLCTWLKLFSTLLKYRIW
jgi:hypothetical protein